MNSAAHESVGGDMVIELRRHVERIVRPLAAKATRKDRFRVELHNHLLAAYQQEVDRGASHDQALATALERFGNIGEVRRELQVTVPRLERILMSDVLPFGLGRLQAYIRRHPGEPAVRSGLRLSLFTFFATFVPCIVFVGTALLVRTWLHRPARIDSLTKFALPLFGIVFVLHVVFPLLADGMRKAICPGLAASRSWVRAITLGVISGLAFLGATIGFACLLNWSERAQLLRGVSTYMPWLIAGAALMPFLLALYALASGRDVRRFDEDPWRFLEVER